LGRASDDAIRSLIISDDIPVSGYIYEVQTAAVRTVAPAGS
jgi:hypothetical protein